MRRFSLSTCALASLAISFGVIFSPAATAQAVLPAEIVAKAELNASDQAAVTAWVNGLMPGLSSADVRQIKNTRDGLLSKLSADAKPSVSFRIAMSKAAASALSALVKDKREIVAVNALRVAGEIADPNMMPLLRDGLADARSPVKYGALFGIARAYDAAAGPQPALNPADIRSAMKLVKAEAERTAEPRIVDGAVLVFEAATHLNAGAMAGLRSEAIGEMSVVVHAQVGRVLKAPDDKPIGADMLAPMLRAASVARSAMTQVNVAAPLAPQGAIDAGGIAGDVLLLAAKEMQQADWKKRQASLEQLVGAAESALFLAEAQLGNGQAQQVGLVDALKSGDAAAFKAKVDAVIQRLTKPPFGFPAERFKP